MSDKQYEHGRGNKQILSSVIIAVSLLTSSSMLVSKIQKLIDTLESVRNDHERIFKKLDELSRDR